MTDSIDNTTPSPAIPGMPPLEELAVETIRALVIDGYTSAVMKLSRPVLNELARRFVTEGYERKDTLEWLRGEKGVTQQQFRDYTFDRFVQRFREKLKLVEDRAMDRLIFQQMQEDNGFTDEECEQFLKSKVLMFMAREMATASPHEFDVNRLRAVMSMVQSADQGKLDLAKLALQSEQADHRNAKLQADLELNQQQLELLKQQADHRERQLASKLELEEQRTKLLQQQIEEAERKRRQAIESAKAATTKQAKTSNGQLTEADVLSILDQAMKGEL